MKILAVDMATENCSAALLLDGRVTVREAELERGHAERILPMVDALLADAHLTLSDVDAIAFGRGPGSFTGVRLAATVTQGLAFAAERGVVPISDLQAVAQRAFSEDASASRVIVCNDARMSEVYWACYERHAGLASLVGEEHVGKPSEVRLPSTWPTATAVGRGFAAYGDILKTALPQVSTGPPELAAGTVHLLPRASEIVVLALPLVAAGRILPPEAAIPVYLRDNVVHVAQPPKLPG